MRLRPGWRGISLCIGLLSILPTAVSQQTTTMRGLYISGFVRDDETQHPLKAVNLELQAEAGTTASPPIVSGTGGEFQFNGVISGNYRILAHQQGYESASIPVLLGGTPLSNVIVTLRRSQTTGTSIPGDAISAHQLSIPDKARDNFDKGAKLLTAPNPDYRRALSYFERAIKEYPVYYEAYVDVGIAQHHLGDKVAAEQALRKSVELSSSRYLDALSLLSEMLNDAARFSESEAFARSCATQDDSSWRCDLELARALDGLKRPAEAEAVATKASELNPNHAPTFLVLGNIHIQQHKYAAVVKDFDSYLKLDPSGPQSDQVRATEEQARKALAKTQGPVSSPNPR